MIPIHLKIKGLYSYQQEQSINFEHLVNAGLFGIFGKVGSGKSSILEAISFALYGETERLNLRDNRAYNMMNLKSDELLIEFTFLAGKTRQKYLATVKGRRNKKKHNLVNTIERFAYRFENNDFLPVSFEEVHEAIGLSYTHFKRTIIIPQGKFQEFLQLSDSDRTQMMKDLFNLERFELYSNAIVLENRNNESLNSIDGQLLQLEDINKETIKELEEKLAELKLLTLSTSETLGKLQTDEINLQKLKEAFIKKQQLEEELYLLTSRKTEIHNTELLINKYIDLNNTFNPLFEREKQSTRRLNEITESVKRDESNKKIIAEKLTVHNRELEQVLPLYNNRELLLQKHSELLKLAEIHTLTHKLDELATREQNGANKTKNLNAELLQLKDNIAALEKETQTIKSQMPDLELLARVQTWHLSTKNFVTELQKINTERTTLNTEIESIGNAIQAKSAEILNREEPLETDPKRLIQFIEQEVNKITEEIEDSEKRISNYTVKEKLEAYAEGLESGKPCPLCGSIDHPAPLKAGNTKAENIKEQTALLSLKNMKDRFSTLLQFVNNSGLRIKFIEENLEKLKKKEYETNIAFDNHKKTFIWNIYQDEKELEPAFEEAKNLKSKILNTELQLNDSREKQEELLKQSEVYSKTLNEIKQEITSVKSAREILIKQIHVLNILDYQDRNAEELQKEAEELKLSYETLLAGYEELNTSISQLKSRYDTIEGSLSAQRQNIKATEDEISVIASLIESALQKVKGMSLQQIREMLQQEMNVEARKKEIEDFRRRLHLLQENQRAVSIETGNKTYKEDEHKSLKESIINLRENLDGLNKSIGENESRLLLNRERIKKRENLLQQRANLSIRAENIRTLKNLFKGSGFVKYISSVHLQNLVKAANERFIKLTRQSLGLELNENNNFEIRDYLNGGLLRSVKTLSGGQTFQASLSLALALADNIQHLNENGQNFFFLDEGFGTLDKETLNGVFDTLKALRKENRIVGFISHVEEMQQEIETHIKIDLDEESGSKITESWSA